MNDPSSLAMRHLEPEELRKHVLGQELLETAKSDCLQRMHRAAVFVLWHFLGREWVDAHVLVGRTGSFLMPHTREFVDNYKHLGRVVGLAELLLNLQEVDGFEARMKSIVPRLDVEAAIGELAGAELFVHCGVAFRFVQESGKVGEDYDVEATVAGTAMPCEMKTKLEANQVTASSILHSLNAARKQVPPLKPAIIFVRLPADWFKAEDIGPTLQAVIGKFFRGSKRVNALVFHWEEWTALQPMGAIRQQRSRTFQNPNPRNRLPLGKNFLAQTAPGARWTSIQQVVCDPHPADALVRRVLAATRKQHAGPLAEIVTEVAYEGDYRAVRDATESDIDTAFEFRSKTFDLFSRTSEQADRLIVSFDKHSLPDLGVARLNSVTYQFIVHSAIYDRELVVVPGGVVEPDDRRKRTEAKVAAGMHPLDADEDPVIEHLRALVAALRTEGHLRPEPVALALDYVYYVVRATRAQPFKVHYFARRLTI